ncbi:MAG: Uma2 family endonuclease, partial [Chloroflexi bacterium]|nr:Uma2 family endonuclease [Chloroflexota bacterium]
RKFTVDEYERMGQAGILGEDDRVELIEGEIVEMTPIGHRHAGCVKRLNRLFSQELGTTAVIGIQDPVRLSEDSEPQPDVAVLRPRADLYASAHPTPADVLLLIEVAESSAEPDRRVKVPLYARGGVPEVWLVDLGGETVTVYRDPTPDGYRTERTVQRGETLAPAALPDLQVLSAEVLG